jgi:hypothetical protein
MLLAFTACTTDAPSLIAVSGTITYNGNPVDGANVTLTPESGSDSGGMIAIGTTDAQGKFTVKTNGEPGASAGTYVVTVVKMSAPTDAPTGEPGSGGIPGMPGGDMSKMAENQRKMMEGGNRPSQADIDKMQQEQTGQTSLIPTKYSTSDTSDLKANVTAGGSNDFAFDLTD